MIRFIKSLFSKKLKWYCTKCGHDKWDHDKDGKLVGTCPQGECPCPLWFR